MSMETQEPLAAPSASSTAATLCRAPVDLTQPSTGTAIINRFDIGNHESGEPTRYDRVVIGMNGPAANYRVRYVPQIIHDASGDPVPLRGDADLELRIDGAATHDDTGTSTIPVRDRVVDWGSLRQAKVASDYEGITVIGIGVVRAVDFRVFTLTNPYRLVIDLATPDGHPWACDSGAVQVYFFDEDRFNNNVEPFFTPVWRRVAVPAVAGGALHSLFHGPLGPEHDTGLRLVASGATGFTNLRVQDEVAHVRLTGDCDAGGSTVSIAGSIFPILKQFPNVQYVKIYDEAGQTADPAGLTDSIPDCLNP